MHGNDHGDTHRTPEPAPPATGPATAPDTTGWPAAPAGPPPGQQPPVGWVPPPATPGNRRLVVAASVVVGVVLLVGSLALAGGIMVLTKVEKTADASASAAPQAPDARPSADAEPAESGTPTPRGPEASLYPAEEVQDLGRVCDENVYYPQSPKRAGKAPHPVVLLIDDGSGLRYQNGTYYFSQGLSKTVENTWAAEQPGKVQMVACLDRVSTGAKIRTCSFDDPEPAKVPLLHAGWRLRVYEVATGHTLLDKTMPGDDRKCPYVVMIYGSKIYAGVSDRAVVAALRNLVNK